MDLRWGTIHTAGDSVSLWADYIRECGIMQIIEEPWGFLTFEVRGEELWAGDGYIIPEERGSGRIEELLSRAVASAKEQGCLFFCSRINIRSAQIDLALVSHIQKGFSVFGADEEFIYVRKLI